MLRVLAFCLLLWPSWAWAAAPKVEPEKHANAKAGDWLPVKATGEKDKKLVIDYDGSQVALVRDIRGDLYAIPKAASGTVTVRFWHAGDSVVLPDAGPLPPLPVATLVIELNAPQPPPGKKPPVDPKDPPTQPATGLYFLLVRADGAADPSFTRIVRDPAWQKLKDAGHLVKDFGVSDLNRIGVTLPSGTQIPCVVTLQEDGQRSRIVRGPIQLPSTPEAILDLPKGLSP
ncbi:MAG: hypothetical protein K2X38_08740 [Gemmataceae bacterium]|nr:hypothetical protein [Gemmataceae bacterium]